MSKGMRQLSQKKTEKAEKTFKKLKNHPVYDLAAEYQLLGIHTRGVKTLPGWAHADSAYEHLGQRLATSGPAKRAQLKAFKVSARSIESKRARLETKAFSLAEQKGSVILLDSIDKLFLPWAEKMIKPWDSTRARVVNRNLPTTDYEVATSIMYRHGAVVHPSHYADFWAIKDGIWDIFLKKHPRCQLDQFKKDHPGHSYSRDCWSDEAREMFCQQSLEAALAFLDQYPYSVLELEVREYIDELSKDKQAVAGLLPPDQKHLEDLELYQQLLSIVDCGSPDTATLQRDLYHYFQTYAPRFSAFTLLKRATNYYQQLNQPQNALALLTDMRSYFPDTAACATGFEFQTKKQAWIDRSLDCLDEYGERPIPQFVRRWNTSKYQELSAISWDEGKEAYFARREGKQTWVMRSVLENDDWSLPQKVEVLSVGKRASPMSLTADGLQMLLKAGRYLYISTRADENAPWNQPQRLSRAFPSMSRAVFAPDGSAILLDASYDPAELWEKPVGNLYYCARDEEGRFKKPKSLGPRINSKKGREANPYLCSDGSTLLFCSTGYDGQGKLDVFVSRKTGNSWTDWSEPESLGCPINSMWDDFGFTWVPDDGRSAFFTVAETCDKDFDVWQTDLPVHARPKLRSQLRGSVVGSNGKPVTKGSAEISINGYEPMTAPISPNGTYRFYLPDTAHTAAIYVNVPGFYTPRDTAHILRGIPVGAVLRDTFQLRTISEIRKSFQLKHASFEAKSAKLNDPLVHNELRLLRRFASNIQVDFRLVCHTDSIGTAEQSLKLSEARVEVLRRILVDSFKMPEKNLRAEGMGATKPLHHFGRNENNRVEVGIEIPLRAFKNPDKKAGGLPDKGKDKNNDKKTAQKPGKKNTGSGGKKKAQKGSTIQIEDDTIQKKKRKTLAQKLFGWMAPKKKDKVEPFDKQEEDDEGNDN